MKKHQLPSSTLIREAAGSAGASGNRFEVVCLVEGLGNFKDAFYYTKAALESLCKVAEGKKIFCNHPTPTEEEEQPERNVLRAFGHYENFRMQEGEGGRSEVVADLVLCEGEAFDRERGLLQHAVKYAEKYKEQDFVGVSILASGDSEEIGLEDLIRQGVPKGCMEKLSQAKDLGVEKVRLANLFTDCTSIDLVTEAGAGGRITKMLESNKERKTMAKKVNKEADGTNPATKDGGAAPAAAHPDKDQDVALIKSMMDKYQAAAKPPVAAPAAAPAKPGAAPVVAAKPEAEGEAMESEAAEAEAMELGKKLKAAYEAAKKMGHEGEAAEAEAVKHVQMAHHMAQTESEAEAEAESEAEKKEAETKKIEAEAEAEAEKGKKESAARIVKLASENSALKERLAKIELTSHMDKTLAESKIPMAATKKFRESVGEIKSKAEFDRLFNVFKSAREATLGGEADKVDFSEAYVNPEREIASDNDSGSELSFEGACAD